MGRKVTLTLFPPAQLELKTLFNDYELKERLEEFLIYGSYPEVLTTESKAEKTALLDELTGSYLLKDIMELERVKSAKALLDLLRLLAFQIGSEVSLRELGAGLGLDYKTVARYLDLLEKSFILFNVRGYSGNLRNEVVKKSKYYFYDTGIRNVGHCEFQRPWEQRRLWAASGENFLFIERLKKRSYKRIYSNPFFWRTWNKQEIDYLEERDGKLFAYEMKWGKKTPAAPKAWKDAYPQAEYEIIDRDNYLDFLT